ncbi:MAG: hypothetical protein LBD30_06745 [Verrucomicrobiales bacterium]|nr:hypothetical protein [Verrucomicrobiales bacterium]
MKKYMIMTGLLMAAITTTSFAQRLQSFVIDSVASQGPGGRLEFTITLSKTQLVMLFASHYSSHGSGDFISTHFDIDGTNYGHYATQTTPPDGSGGPRPHSGSGYYFLELAAGNHTVKIATDNGVVTIPDYSGSGFITIRGGRGEIFAIELGESAGGLSQADLAALETSLRQAIAAGDSATATATNNALTTYQSQVQITVNNLQSQIDALNTNKDALAAQIADLEQQSDSQSALLEQLQQSLATTQQDLSALTTNMANLSALLTGLTDRVATNEQAIANLQNSLTLVNNQLIAYGLRLDAHGALLDQLGIRLDEHGNLLDTHGNLLDEHGALLSQLGVRLDAHDNLLDSHGNLIARLTTQLKRQQQKLERTTDLAWAGVGLGNTGVIMTAGALIAGEEDPNAALGTARSKTQARPGYNKTTATKSSATARGGNNYQSKLSGQK